VAWTYCFETSRTTDFVCRKAVDSSFYYGWYRAYVVDSSFIDGNWPRHKAWIYVDKMAFCTVPNYKLEWGETRIIDMDKSPRTNSIPYMSAIQVHPNPTSGFVRIEGTNVTEVNVYNALGQLMRTMQSTNELNLKGLPLGIYTLCITNQEGFVVTKKVMVE
jgi:hypothetical protein